MLDQCYTASDLERLAGLPPGHEDLKHLASCAACRAELAYYRSFVAPGPIPETADLADAETRLSLFLAREVEKSSPSGAADSSPFSASRKRIGRSWSQIMIAAGLAGVILFAGYRNISHLDSPSGVVRGGTETVSSLVPSQIATPEGFLLTWSSPQAADSIEIIILDADMTEVKRIPATLTGRYLLERDQHTWLQETGPFFWSVVALQGGDEIAHSPIHALEPGH